MKAEQQRCRYTDMNTRDYYFSFLDPENVLRLVVLPLGTFALFLIRRTFISRNRMTSKTQSLSWASFAAFSCSSTSWDSGSNSIEVRSPFRHSKSWSTASGRRTSRQYCRKVSKKKEIHRWDGTDSDLIDADKGFIYSTTFLPRYLWRWDFVLPNKLFVIITFRQQRDGGRRWRKC